ncbi:hypothetical protein F5890DRAFT_610319 [Lentinula detonsa]|uniref:Uncharacterized protein n=1 Tax=Lentinula detonsa TaxID=2804962 RepID=A0AA38PSQ9_9AGAR|nr:hypothetical protein F5890DRAFT_610319 [Lentinula detonsa]
MVVQRPVAIPPMNYPLQILPRALVLILVLHLGFRVLKLRARVTLYLQFSPYINLAFDKLPSELICYVLRVCLFFYPFIFPFTYLILPTRCFVYLKRF